MLGIGVRWDFVTIKPGEKMSSEEGKEKSKTCILPVVVIC